MHQQMENSPEVRPQKKDLGLWENHTQQLRYAGNNHMFPETQGGKYLLSQRLVKGKKENLTQSGHPVEIRQSLEIPTPTQVEDTRVGNSVVFAKNWMSCYCPLHPCVCVSLWCEV